MGGDDDELEGGDQLNYYPALVHHKFGCVDEGKWEGSCDIDLTPPPVGKRYTIHAKADWSDECDPLKAEAQLGTLNYTEGEGWENADGEIEVGWTNSKTPNWTCPMEERNPSGCGDFRTDTRNLECPNEKSIFNCGRPNNADNLLMRFGELPALDIPQRHVCIQHPIFYDNIYDGGTFIPPALGRHRERWAKWGEYEFLPPQVRRYLPSVHGVRYNIVIISILTSYFLIRHIHRDLCTMPSTAAQFSSTTRVLMRRANVLSVDLFKSGKIGLALSSGQETGKSTSSYQMPGTTKTNSDSS
jgi:hypothetical protein